MTIQHCFQCLGLFICFLPKSISSFSVTFYNITYHSLPTSVLDRAYSAQKVINPGYHCYLLQHHVHFVLLFYLFFYIMFSETKTLMFINYYALKSQKSDNIKMLRKYTKTCLIYMAHNIQEFVRICRWSGLMKQGVLFLTTNNKHDDGTNEQSAVVYKIRSCFTGNFHTQLFLQPSSNMQHFESLQYLMCIWCQAPVFSKHYLQYTYFVWWRTSLC